MLSIAKGDPRRLSLDFIGPRSHFGLVCDLLCCRGNIKADRSTRVLGLWSIKYLVLLIALLVVISASRKLAAAACPKPGT